MKSILMKQNVQLAIFAIVLAVGAFAGVLDPAMAAGVAMIGAVVTVKSTQITNRDATPAVINNRTVQGGEVRHARGVCAIANGDDIGSKYIFCSVPAQALITSIRISSPDIGTTTIADIGLYRTTADGSAVVDADLFASALSLKDGALSKSEVLFESTTITLANSEKRLWQHIAALTADPQCLYDVAATLTAAADAAGSVLLEVDYIV